MWKIKITLGLIILFATTTFAQLTPVYKDAKMVVSLDKNSIVKIGPRALFTARLETKEFKLTTIFFASCEDHVFVALAAYGTSSQSKEPFLGLTESEVYNVDDTPPLGPLYAEVCKRNLNDVLKTIPKVEGTSSRSYR